MSWWRDDGWFIRHSLVLTDHASGWTECVPLIVRDSALVVEGIASVRARKNDQACVEQKNGAIVRKMVGYERYEGLVAAQCFARFYAALRLYVNFFQPSFKLLEKRRVGGRVKKRYLRPATPCDRLIMSRDIDEETRERLGLIRERLDPVALLERIRAEQSVLAQIAAGAADSVLPPKATDLDHFMESLAIAFRDGEIRTTHRKKDRKRSTAPRHWRTRQDPFDDVWEWLERRLVEAPDTTAQSLFESLQIERPGRYSDGQLRTLQRRVKAWRTKEARKLLALDDETTTAGVGSVRFFVSPESSISS